MIDQAVRWRTLRERNRDRFVADNARWVSGEAHPQSRVVILAHGVHTHRIPDRMGSFLGEQGASLVVGLMARRGEFLCHQPRAAGRPGDPLLVQGLRPHPLLAELPAALTAGAATTALDLRRLDSCALPSATPASEPRELDLLVILDQLHPIEPIESQTRLVTALPDHPAP